jgi:hypothetical protein
MGNYQHNMSDEKAPSKKKLLPEGIRGFEVVSCEPSISKSGNDMFIVELKDIETQYIDKVYLVATQGKRWALKQLLTACGVTAGKDGVYDWSTSDIIGKEINGEVEHEDNEYINREGVTIKGKQHRIVSFTEREWDADK